MPASIESRTSRFHGVRLDRGRSRWVAFVSVAGRRMNVGVWPTEAEAASARDRAALHFNLSVPLNDARRAIALGPCSPADLRATAASLRAPRKSGPYFGVEHTPARAGWHAFLNAPGCKHLGYFARAEDAAIARDRVAIGTSRIGSCRRHRWKKFVGPLYARPSSLTAAGTATSC